jgi:hypothetical protein
MSTSTASPAVEPGVGSTEPAVTTVTGPLPPVVSELPELAHVLRVARHIDTLCLHLVRRLAALLDDSLVEHTTGQSVEAWLGWQAGHTGLDRRLLERAARLLLRLPSLARAVRDRQLSWPQLRGLAIGLRQLPAELDAELDAFLAGAIPTLVGTDPDTLVDHTRRALDELRAEREPAAPTRVPNRLSVQPWLDGTGGVLHGELDATGLAIVDAATAPDRDQLDHPGGIAGARADNLVHRLGSATDDVGVDPSDACPGLPPVRLLLRMDLDTLLGDRALPTDVLTTLVGGKLTLTSDHARRLLDARGASVRTVVVDGGRVLGVGRTSRIPPAWIRDVLSAVHDTCTAPGCNRSARTCDTDHATPWQSFRPHEHGGPTDVDNLAPLCPPTNRGKESEGWRTTQTADGSRTWHHPRSGITIRTVPATWEPPGWRDHRTRTRSRPDRGRTRDGTRSRDGTGPPVGDADLPF